MTDDSFADDAKPEPGIALCLSGGGYRAMVFHLGALIRLNEAGLLSRLARVSSVSGGSITAGYLALRWNDLAFDASGRATRLHLVVDKIRAMARTDVDAGAILGGLLLPGSIGDRVARSYDDELFEGAMLSDLPDDRSGKAPRFVINATNVQSGALWRFSRPYMGDYRVGLFRNPTLKLSLAVAASSAFPPVLSPVTVPISDPVDPSTVGDLGPGFQTEAVLSDGGVYDNLGLETAFKRYQTILVSDGGQKIAADETPAHDWMRHSIRILNIVDNQVRSLRKRQLIDAYKANDRTGTYWGIRTAFSDYGAPSDPLGCTGRDPRPLAETPTRLEALSDVVQEKLINWGYAIADTALRTHFGPALQSRYSVSITAPAGFPYGHGY